MRLSSDVPREPLHLEWEDGGTTVELVVQPLHIWYGYVPAQGRYTWFMSVYDMTAQMHLDLPLESIKRWWVPKTAEQMQLSGTAIVKFGKLLP